jgi:NADH dehydrogenase
MRGYRVRAAVRRPDLAGHLRPLGMVGQVQPVQANIRYPDSIRAAVDGAVAVVNLVGILAERGRQTFGAVHVDGAAAVANIAGDAGVEHLVHMSALGADEDSESHYFRTKAKGEESVRHAFPRAFIFRPSIQFGVGDSFFSRFAGIARIAPFLPLIGANTRFQPVYVGDVAAAIRIAVDGEAEQGVTFELGGAEILSFRECMVEMLKVIDRRRLLPPVPLPLAKLAGAVLQYLPGRILTLDQVRQLQYDNVVSPAAIAEERTLGGLGIGATALEAILPTYLSRFRPHGEFRRQSQA